MGRHNCALSKSEQRECSRSRGSPTSTGRLIDGVAHPDAPIGPALDNVLDYRTVVEGCPVTAASKVEARDAELKRKGSNHVKLDCDGGPKVETIEGLGPLAYFKREENKSIEVRPSF